MSFKQFDSPKNQNLIFLKSENNVNFKKVFKLQLTGGVGNYLTEEEIYLLRG